MEGLRGPPRGIQVLCMQRRGLRKEPSSLKQVGREVIVRAIKEKLHTRKKETRRESLATMRETTQRMEGKREKVATHGGGVAREVWGQIG